MVSIDGLPPLVKSPVPTSKLGGVDQLEEAKEPVGASKLEEVKKPDATKSELQLDQIIQINKEANYSIENNVQAHCFI